MDASLGLRERKKLETRHRLGDVAARLFADRGYDAVSISDVARAGGVSDQTVYNYFPTKPELVLDRAGEILERTRQVVSERDPSQTPADALRPLVHEDIERFRDADASIARGEFPAQCLKSETLRRFALDFRHDQAGAIAAEIVVSDPRIHALVAQAHASALVTIIQAITDRIGAAVIADSDRALVAADLRRDADIALDDAAANFSATRSRALAHETIST